METLVQISHAIVNAAAAAVAAAAVAPAAAAAAVVDYCESVIHKLLA